MQRAWEAIQSADRVLLIAGTQQAGTTPKEIWPEFTKQLPPIIVVTLVRNKIDLLERGRRADDSPDVIAVSARAGEGLKTLTDHLKACMGYQPSSEGQFIARRRHLQALAQSKDHCICATTTLSIPGWRTGC